MNLKQLDENRVELALTTLANTDDEEANLAVAAESADQELKRIYGQQYLKATGTVAERDALAINSEEYKEACVLWAASQVSHKKIKNKRKHEEMIVDVWRTLEASRRKA